ncbi:hypothetical protein ACJJTC_011462 [Scirpophaga incertulas]
MKHLFVLLALLGCAVASSMGQNTDLAALYQLPQETRPTHYDISLFLDPDNSESFYGNVTIRIVATTTTNEIVLHAMELDIQMISVHNERVQEDIYVSHELAEDDTHFLRIKLNETMTVYTVYILKIDFVGKYATNMFGIYLSTYAGLDGQSDGKLITSQLQPTFARRAFPCYDEPALKAIFKTTIYAPATYSVVRTNMDEPIATRRADGDYWVKHEFKETLVMSTYLLAFLVSNFDYIHNEENALYRVPFRIYSRPGTQDAAKFALSFGQLNMEALENYTQFEYAFPKMDKVAVPDFAAGAMENWGLVIYREAALLFTEGVTTTSTKQGIASIICHENMHMWFGNEVSPISWTYTWLNEGFANFFQSFATDLVLPEWRMMDQYVLAMQNVFQADAVQSTNPMNFEVYTPSQILGTFNAVAYQKSGSVIRMMQHFLTPEVFQKGLIRYLRTYSRKAVIPDDLLLSFQAALDESEHRLPDSIRMIMYGWTVRSGFPVVKASRSASSANSLILQQERYLTDSSISSNNIWFIPINVVLSNNPDFSDTKPDAWMYLEEVNRVDIIGLSEVEWYIINKQQTGYYRVNYDEENWMALARVLNSSHEVVHLLNRAQIIDDSFNLARTGRLPYRYPMQIARYLVKEKDYIPWASANAAFNYLDAVLSGSDVYDLYKQFLLDLTAPLYESLTFTASNEEEHVTAYHRNIILNINCRFGNTACVSRASELLQAYKNGGSLNPDIQTLVFCSGLRGGDESNFEYLWSLLLETTDSTLVSVLLSALGCTSNSDTRDFYLKQIIDEDSPIREQDRHSIAVSVINSGHENMEAALDFIVENFNLIQNNVQGLSGTRNILTALSNRLTTKAHADKIDELVRKHGNIFTAAEEASIGAIRENIAASTNWREKNLDVVTSWLKDYYKDGASAMTAGFLVIISIAVTLFNY